MERNRFRRAVGVVALSVLVGFGTSVVPGTGNTSAAAPVPAPTSKAAPNAVYFSSADELVASRSGGRNASPRTASSRAADDEPKPAPTKGTVVGRALSTTGQPLAGALVIGVRFRDLGVDINTEVEQRVVAFTKADGRFTLPQLTERYLVKICSTLEDLDNCIDAPDVTTFAPTWIGPDGVTDSWLLQTRFFSPVQPRRDVGTVRVKPRATLQGRYVDGAFRQVRLLRGDGSQAASTTADENGRYRIDAAPGTYRVEAYRDEGLDTPSSQPGFRSAPIRLSASRSTDLLVRTAAVTVLSGRLTRDGRAVVDEPIVVLDRHGRLAGGTATNGDGEYRFESLRPGRYTVTTTNLFSQYAPVSRSVNLSRSTAVRADFALSIGAGVVFRPVDADTEIFGAELRDDRGRLVKSYPDGRESEDGSIQFSGLRPGRYQLLVQRVTDPAGGGDLETDFPWTTRTVDLAGTQTLRLGDLRLDRPSVDLVGSGPVGGQLGFVPRLADSYLTESAIKGTLGSTLTQNWSTPIGADGRFRVYGIVPGRYVVRVTTALIDTLVSTTGGNVATTLTTLTVLTGLGSVDLRRNFTAPVGAVVTGRLSYVGSKRPLIAPVAVRASDLGAESWLFPTVGGAARYGGRFRVERVHRGPVRITLLDQQKLKATREQRGVGGLPNSLLDWAPLGEDATPYWFEARPRWTWATPGRRSDVGTIAVRIRGR